MFEILDNPASEYSLTLRAADLDRILTAFQAKRRDSPPTNVRRGLHYRRVAENGCRAESYTELQGVVAMTAEEITITIDLNRGERFATVWTSDLSHEYVRINAEYRT